MKNFVGKKLCQVVPFMGEKVKVFKLSTTDVKAVQALSKIAEDAEPAEKEEASIALVRGIIRHGVEGADELTDAEFDTFPMEDLGQLANTVMDFSGLRGDKGKA